MGVGASLAFWPLLRRVPLPARLKRHLMLEILLTIFLTFILDMKPGNKWSLCVHVIGHHQRQSVCRKARLLHITLFILALHIGWVSNWQHLFVFPGWSFGCTIRKSLQSMSSPSKSPSMRFTSSPPCNWLVSGLCGTWKKANGVSSYFQSPLFLFILILILILI